MDYIVGYTGFVGSNIVLKHEFDGKFNSKNIEEAYGGNPDLLVYAGVPAEMFLANTEPEKDKQIIEQAIDNIKKISPKRIVLISTIAVYPDSRNATEETEIVEKDALPYGANRRYLEQFVEKYTSEYLIVRLPAIYGENLKKNFLYDYIHFIPSMLKEEKYLELQEKEEILKKFYLRRDNGFYYCKNVSGEERKELIKCFERLGFSALNFTDSRSEYQFYNLNNLWNDIQIAMNNNIKVLNIATEPVSVGELYQFLEEKEFINELNKPALKYDLKTIHAERFAGKNGYMLCKNEVMQDIKRYVIEEKAKL